MTQATTTPNTATTNGNTNGSSNDSVKREAKTLTAIDAISKISKILDQLSSADRKRVLVFVNETNEVNA